ncbi:hypothetical protein BDW69DRAFT_195896 [Aspergillus filifer]
MSTPFLRTWHKYLSLPRISNRTWHLARLSEELAERAAATTHLSRLSETADILFILSRARYDGSPLHLQFHACYMLGKFTSRWGFYQVAALCAGERDWRGVREVVNPRKMSKVAEVARRHVIEKEKFGRVCCWLLWVWPVLP